jgi:sugar-phosphatase
MRITIHAVLFDLDGVLADSTDMVASVWRTWARERGLDAEEVVSVAHGRPTRELIGRLTPHLSSEEEARTIERIEVESSSAIKAIRGAVELLAATATAELGRRDVRNRGARAKSAGGHRGR